jgi:kojibiose phosphorylase
VADVVGDGPDSWLVEEAGFDRERANRFESLLAVGNGRLGTRGSLEEGHLGHLPGTFLAGVYDAVGVPVAELVSAPDWLDTAVFVDGVRLDVDTCTVVAHHRALDLRTGVLRRTTVFADATGRRTRLATWRCASVADRRICALRVEVTPEDHAGEIRVETGVDGDRRNLDRPARYPEGTLFAPGTRWEKWARARHLRETARAVDGDVLYLQMRTLGGGVDLGYASATAFDRPPRDRWVRQRSARITEETVHRGAVRMDKLVAVCTSRDPGPLRDRCLAALAGAGGFDAVAAASAAVWARLWDDCDCEVVGNPRLTRALRLAVYHLLIAANPDDPTVGVGANGLTGERYRGHVFWDAEIFLLPFFTLTQPDAARALLRYRHHTLDGARANSRENGTGGARYPWESADTGREECPVFTPDGTTRIWPREEEIHVSADVAYGMLGYVEATGDTAFLHEQGAEVLFETSRFWADRVEPTGGGYALRRVMGPDEFHSHVDDNAFTNELVRWQLTRAVALYDELRPGGVPAEERDRWQEVAAGLTPAERRDGVVEQFTGYFAREDLPIIEWDADGIPRYPPGHDHFTLETTQLIKQPDVVMLAFLLPELLDPATVRSSLAYYEARTLHKSSLSHAIHAIVGIRVGETASAARHFERSALVDLADTRGNTDLGMHVAAAAGTWQALVAGFGGLRIRGGRLTLDPWLPHGWDGIRFRLRWRGRPLRVAVDREGVELLLGGPAGAVEVEVCGRPVRVTAGEPLRVSRR